MQILEETYPVHPQVDRRGKSRLTEAANIEVRYGKRYKDFTPVTLIESTRHGARLILSDSPNRDDGLEYQVRIGRNTFEGQARVAWSQPLSNHRTVVGLEFVTFKLRP